MVLGGSDPYLTSGSGTTSGTTSDDDTFTTTSTDDSDDFDGGTIDLGHSPAGGGSQNFDLENNDAAVVDTGDDIADAGGPEGVLVGTEEQARKVKDTVSEVTGQLRDMASSDDPDSEDLPAPAENPSGDGDSSPVDLDDLPVGFGGLGLPSLPSVGEIGGKGVAVALAGLGAVAVVFGGE